MVTRRMARLRDVRYVRGDGPVAGVPRRWDLATVGRGGPPTRSPFIPGGGFRAPRWVLWGTPDEGLRQPWTVATSGSFGPWVVGDEPGAWFADFMVTVQTGPSSGRWARRGGG